MSVCDGNGTFTREEIHGGEWCEVVAGTCAGCSACMRMLSLTQPWCSLVAKGVKTIETRSFGTTYRGLIAFQATLDQGPWNQIRVDGTRRTGFYPESAALVRPFRFAMGVETLPFGAVVAVADLVDVLPMTTHCDLGDPECIVVGDGYLDHCIPIGGPNELFPTDVAVVRLDAPEIDDGAHLIRDISDQRPFGLYEPGRFGWMLENIRQLKEPVPAKGFQGLRACPQDVAVQIAEQL